VLSFLTAAPVATLAALVFGAVETGGFALLALYGLRLGFAPEAAAYLLTAVALGNVALQIPIGLLSDRVDRRLVLLASGLAGAAGPHSYPGLPSAARPSSPRSSCGAA
jgi:MFS family permease